MLPDHCPAAARIRGTANAPGDDRQPRALAACDGQGGRPPAVHRVSTGGPMIRRRRARLLGCLLAATMTLLAGCTLGPSQRPALATFGAQPPASSQPASSTPPI